MGTPSGPKYIPYTYMDPLGFGFRGLKRPTALKLELRGSGLSALWLEA